jgi:hypothetical protein
MNTNLLANHSISQNQRIYPHFPRPKGYHGSSTSEQVALCQTTSYQKTLHIFSLHTPDPILALPNQPWEAEQTGQGTINLGNFIEHLVTSKGECSVLVTCNPLILKHVCIELHTKQEQRSQPLGFLGDTSCSGPQSVSLLASTPAPVCKNGYARQQIMGWLKDSNTHTHKVEMGPTTSLLSPTPHKTILTQGWKQCMTPPTLPPP